MLQRAVARACLLLNSRMCVLNASTPPPPLVFSQRSYCVKTAVQTSTVQPASSCDQDSAPPYCRLSVAERVSSLTAEQSSSVEPRLVPLLARYSSVAQLIHHVHQLVALRLSQLPLFAVQFSQQTSRATADAAHPTVLWCARLCVNWLGGQVPEFEATAARKAVARKLCYEQYVRYLLWHKVMDDKGNPVFCVCVTTGEHYRLSGQRPTTTDNASDTTTTPPSAASATVEDGSNTDLTASAIQPHADVDTSPVHIDDTFRLQADFVHDKTKNLEERIVPHTRASDDCAGDYHLSESRVDVMTGHSLLMPSGDAVRTRSKTLLKSLVKQECFRGRVRSGVSQDDDVITSHALPVNQHRREILELFSSQQDDKHWRCRAVVVKAAENSGKTSQLPQVLFDSHVVQARGATCNVLVTQPRHVAATCAATWVARQRCEPLGESVGVHVPESCTLLQQRGGIVYCTHDVLLAQLARNQYLAGVSHLLIDQAHERTPHTLKLLELARQVLEVNTKINVVLMCDLTDTDFLNEYFCHAPVLEITS